MDVGEDVLRSEESLDPLLLKASLFTRECVCNLWRGAHAAFPEIMKGLEGNKQHVRAAASRSPPPLASSQQQQFLQALREPKQLLRAKLRELSCEDALHDALRDALQDAIDKCQLTGVNMRPPSPTHRTPNHPSSQEGSRGHR